MAENSENKDETQCQSEQKEDYEKQSPQQQLQQQQPQQHQDSVYEFVRKLEDYTPVIPDVVVTHYLNSAGFRSGDTRVVRLIALAAQKFVADIIGDSLQHCKLRGQNKVANKVLKLDDLTAALDDYGLRVKKPHYFI
ncbi:Transcription initiation factor TFIID subunit 10, partial [Fragariocoptes setiger]